MVALRLYSKKINLINPWLHWFHNIIHLYAIKSISLSAIRSVQLIYLCIQFCGQLALRASAIFSSIKYIYLLVTFIFSPCHRSTCLSAHANPDANFLPTSTAFQLIGLQRGAWLSRRTSRSRLCSRPAIALDRGQLSVTFAVARGHGVRSSGLSHQCGS